MGRIHIITIILFQFLILSCAHDYKRPENMEGLFKPVGPAEAMELIRESEGLQIVDTRTGWERSSGWIANSVHVSYFSFLFGGGYDKLRRDEPVLLVCAHGIRSYRVGRALVRKGWKEVYDLEGGMKAWITDGYPVVSEQEAQLSEDITKRNP